MKDDRNIPYVAICHDVLDMNEYFEDLLAANAGMIEKATKRRWKIEFKDGTIVLFVTKEQFDNPLCPWWQGRTYKIVGDGGRIYHGKSPFFTTSIPIDKWKER